MSGKADYLDGQSRRNNLVIDDIQESQSETWVESEDKVRKLFSEELQLDQQVELEHAHQSVKPEGTGGANGGANGTRLRPIVVEFLRSKYNLQSLKKPNVLKGPSSSSMRISLCSLSKKKGTNTSHEGCKRTR